MQSLVYIQPNLAPLNVLKCRSFRGLRPMDPYQGSALDCCAPLDTSLNLSHSLPSKTLDSYLKQLTLFHSNLPLLLNSLFQCSLRSIICKQKQDVFSGTRIPPDVNIKVGRLKVTVEVNNFGTDGSLVTRNAHVNL